MSGHWPLASHVTYSEVDGGAILLDTRRGRYWQLNATGAEVVKGLDSGMLLDDVIAAVCADTGEAVERVGPDVRTLVESLRRARLLVKRR